jgi:hypothetical protein
MEYRTTSRRLPPEQTCSDTQQLTISPDLFTLTAAELILWPIEITAMEAATCSATATYDTQNRVRSWYVGKKTESQGMQDC